MGQVMAGGGHGRGGRGATYPGEGGSARTRVCVAWRCATILWRPVTGQHILGQAGARTQARQGGCKTAIKPWEETASYIWAAGGGGVGVQGRPLVSAGDNAPRCCAGPSEPVITQRRPPPPPPPPRDAMAGRTRRREHERNTAQHHGETVSNAKDRTMRVQSLVTFCATKINSAGQ